MPQFCDYHIFFHFLSIFVSTSIAILKLDVYQYTSSKNRKKDQNTKKGGEAWSLVLFVLKNRWHEYSISGGGGERYPANLGQL